MSRSAATPIRYRLDYMDRGCLVGTSKEHGCSNAPTWELEVAGRIDPGACLAALQLLVRRYPTCASTLVPANEPKHYVVALDPRPEQLFAFHDLRASGPAAFEKLRAEIRARFIDLASEFPLHVTLARVAEDRCFLFFKQHHAVADGRAFIGMLGDFALFLEHAATGAPLPAELAEVFPRQSELAALEIPRWKAIAWGLSGLATTFRLARGLQRHPLVTLRENGSRDYRGTDGMVHIALDGALLERWRPARERHRISLGALLAGAHFLASLRWNGEHGVAPGRTRMSLVAETRPRHGRFRSFANHLGGLLVELPLDRDLAPLEMLRSIDAQLREQVASDSHKKRLVFERFATALLPLALMRQVLFDPRQRLNANLTLSNLIALRFPTLAGTGWTVDAIEITTPILPPFGVMLTVIHYNGKLRFNLNHKESIVPRAQAEELARHFERALADMTAALES
jgi:hypothetical protein